MQQAFVGDHQNVLCCVRSQFTGTELGYVDIWGRDHSASNNAQFCTDLGLSVQFPHKPQQVLDTPFVLIPGRA